MSQEEAKLLIHYISIPYLRIFLGTFGFMEKTKEKAFFVFFEKPLNEYRLY